MIPTQVEPDGEAFATASWTDVIELPTHRTNSDGTQGSAIDWSGSTFTIDSNLPASVVIVVTPSGLSGSTPTVTLSMDEATTALITSGKFRYYLRESPVFGGDPFLWRRVAVDRER